MVASSHLCDVHTWCDIRWIEHLTDVIGYEIGPRLENLRTAPRQLISLETEELLGMLHPYIHIFPFSDPSTPSTPNASECNIQDCGVCNTTTCKACKLSSFFQNSEAVKALLMCAKGRKKRNHAWPEAIAWLEPEPGPGWEGRWREEGLGVLSDRIIIRRWLKIGGRERMASVSGMVGESEEDVCVREGESEMGREKRVTGCSTYDAIVERNWTLMPEAGESSETVELLQTMGMGKDGKRVGVAEGEGRAESWGTAYDMLVGSPQAMRASIRLATHEALRKTFNSPDSSDYLPRHAEESFDDFIEDYANDDTAVEIPSPERNSFDFDAEVDEDDTEVCELNRPLTAYTKLMDMLPPTPPLPAQSKISLAGTSQKQDPYWRPKWAATMSTIRPT